MAIHVIFGPGGTGKSYFQMRLIVSELVTSKRNVVTNLAINLGRLQEYLEQKHPTISVDVTQRVRILTRDEAKEFWRFRGPVRLTASDLWEGAESTDVGTAQCVVDPGRDGVLFVIDEAGVAGFDATGWASTDGKTTRGAACSWYLDQQRKFADDVYASVNGRAPHGIAKPFRDKAHVFLKLKNGYLQTFGMFRGRGRFTASHYAGEPSPTNEPFKIEHWEMDASGIGSCYRTQDGVGVEGVKADMGKRAKGIPILMAIPMAIAFGLVVAVGVPMLLAKGVAKYTEAKGAKVKQVAKEERSQPGRKEDTPKLVESVSKPIAHDGPRVSVVGLVRAGNRVNVTLSDGRVLTETEEYLRIERGYVESPRGVRYPMARIEPKTVPAIATPQPAAAKPEEPKPVIVPYAGESLFPASESVGRLEPIPTLQTASAGTRGGSAGSFRR